jgi:hypothetical protein
MKRAIALFLLLGSQAASALTGSASSTVQYVYTYGDGRVLVTGPGFTFAGATCQNSGGGFWIDGAHPHLQRILALVLTAKTSGLTLIVNAKIDNCWYPEIVNDASTYVIIGP